MRILSVSERLNAERLVLLGWSRAILLQLAHPLVAAGVAEHSTFREGLFTASRRLHHTVGSMLSLTFGSEVDREATLNLIRGIHRRVHGELREDAGVFRAGTPYSAEDPALLLWVHATLLDSIPLVYDRLVAPLSEAERDAYCRETAPLVQALGAPDPGPQTWDATQRYLKTMYESGQIAVSRQAKELAWAVLAPPLAWTIAPATRVNRLMTLGWLPAWIRDAYGFSWTERDERALARSVRIVSSARRLAPRRLATWKQAR